MSGNFITFVKKSSRATTIQTISRGRPRRRRQRSRSADLVSFSIIPFFPFLFATVAEDAAADVAKEPEPRRHILTDIPEANDDIDTVTIFPDYPAGGSLHSGEPLKVLLGFRNNGESPMNVSHIAGSVNAPMQYSFYVMNFTVAEYLSVVEPGKEASFEYQFYLDPVLAGHDFTVAFTAFYQDDTEKYASTFYNSTISVLDPVRVFDAQTAFMYLALFGLVLGAAYLGLQATGTLPAVKSALKKILGGGKKSYKKETGTGGDYDSNEWLKGTSWTTHGKEKKKAK